ncbi:MAG: GNAT family N-acetyltransferase [Ignavibacteriaceae bacterium]
MRDLSVEIRGCNSKKELIEVVDLCDAAFPKTPREYFERHVLKDKTLDEKDTRILLIDGKIVSSVQVFPRTIYVQKEKIKIGGIGNVATLPAERGKGYAGLLVKDSLDYIIKKGYTLSMLTTSINSYYEKFGFQTIVRTIANINCNEGKNHKEISQFDKTNDLKNIINIYDGFNSGKIGTIVRDEKYWLSQIEFSGEDKDLFLIYESKGEAIGFIRAQRKENYITVLEYAFKDNNTLVFAKLIEELSYMTDINEFKLFLTMEEEEIINSRFSISLKNEKDFMICFLDNSLSMKIKNELLKDRNLNFWQSDFF